MKYLIVIIAFLLFGCSNNPEKAIIGSWVTFDSYRGISEIEFKKDRTIVETNIIGGEDNHSIVKGNYTFIDGYLFISLEYDNNRNYNYVFLKDKLILSGSYIDPIIYNKLSKKKNNISVSKNNLIGTWTFPDYMLNITLTFTDSHVNIKEYDRESNLTGEENYPYELTDRYLIINNIDYNNNSSSINRFDRRYMRRGIFLYNINKDRLILNTGNGEEGITASMFLMKVKG